MKSQEKRIKMAVVVGEDIFAMDGTTVRVNRVIELMKNRCDVTIIATSDKTQTAFMGLNNVKIKGLGLRRLMYCAVPKSVKSFFVLLWNIKLGFTLLQNHFDVVYSAHEWFGFPAVYFISKVKKYKTIFEAHSVFSLDFKEAGHTSFALIIDHWLEKFVAEHCDSLMALSPETLNFYRKYNTNIRLYDVFVDTEIFKPTIKTKTVKTKTIGIIGPFNATTRQKHYLEFLYSKIDCFDNRIIFLIIGNCEEKLSHERIKYTGYIKSIRDYAKQLSYLDAVLIPENISTQGPRNKILEPLSCSVPVFTTPKGIIGLPWVKPNEDILVCEEKDLTSTVNALLFNEELMCKIGGNGRRIIEQYYSKRVNEQKLLVYWIQSKRASYYHG
jgi:glycosyltransferase involved in cell wall biosynthesis